MLERSLLFFGEGDFYHQELVNDGKPTNSLFWIKDARIVNLPETGSNAKMVKSVIKRMTGADSNAKLPNERLVNKRLDEEFATEEFRESCLS